MLKLKKIFLAMMVAALAVTGFVSCSNDDDSDNKPTTTQTYNDNDNDDNNVATVVDAQTDLYGTYTGSMTVMGTESAVSLAITDGKFALNSGHPATYTKILWLKDADGNYVVAAQSDPTNTKNGDLTVDNYTTASSNYVVFGTDAITYYVPAMAAMGGTCTLTKLPYIVDAQTDLFGTYTGSMTVMGTESAVSLTIADGKFAITTGHPATYTKILWLKDADGNYVVAAQSDDTNTKNSDLTVLNYTTASSNYVVFGTDAITYYVPAMAAMGGTCTLTKSE